MDNTTSGGPNGSPKFDWNEILQRNERWLRCVILARLGEPQAVDEVLQEVSLAAVSQRAKLADPEKMGPWLYQIAVRQSLLFRRKMGRKRKLIDRYADRFQPHESDNRTVDPLSWLLADERRKLVRVALENLNARDAEILLLKYTEDWSYKQLAEHLSISASAVEARLHRARAKLRDELTRLEVDED
jgi:RNA polymerase sigma-70 factor (ECF subfamily)